MLRTLLNTLCTNPKDNRLNTTLRVRVKTSKLIIILIKMTLKIESFLKLYESDSCILSIFKDRDKFACTDVISHFMFLVCNTYFTKMSVFLLYYRLRGKNNHLLTPYSDWNYLRSGLVASHTKQSLS
jgi:hypothetical protein